MKLTTLFILIFNTALLCQNLVPNPGFEEIRDTISKFTKDHIEFESKIQNWSTPNLTSPDLITPEFEEIYIKPPAPHTGSMMIGIQSKIDWSEYIGIALSKALTPNRTYYAEYWIRRSFCIRPSMNVDQIMNENFGILFSPDSIKSADKHMLLGSPQITIDTQLLITDKEWMKISGYFTPKTTCNYLYLGQFRKKGEVPPNMKGYYVIDDITVKEIDGFESLDTGEKLPVGSIIPLNNINFLTGSTELRDKQSYITLKELTTYLNSNPSIKIRINGHTDSNGSKKSNFILSKKRARSIAQNIIKNGISKNRIEWKGFGEEQPIADNKTAKGRSINRRVEFEVMD